MERILAIYDTDQAYAQRLAEFINRREKQPFTAVPFTSLEKLKEYEKDHAIEILLVGGNLRKEVSGLKARQIVSLCDKEVVELGEEKTGIYKYQSGDSVMREVMACYCQQPAAQALAFLGARAMIIGIYSPVNRCLKTSLALTMGQLMAKSERVLYVNLEEYSGFSRLMKEEYSQDLSDVLYLYRQKAYNWLRLKAMVHTWGGMDYIPPVRYGEDLNQVSPEEMARLIERIAGEGGYERLLVDVGQMGRGALPILEVCDAVYMPVKEDSVSAAKVEEFEEYLKTAGAKEVLEKIRRLRLPYHNDFGKREGYLEQLLWGELGDYVRKLLYGLGAQL